MFRHQWIGLFLVFLILGQHSTEALRKIETTKLVIDASNRVSSKQGVRKVREQGKTSDQELNLLGPSPTDRDLTAAEKASLTKAAKACVDSFVQFATDTEEEVPDTVWDQIEASFEAGAEETWKKGSKAVTKEMKKAKANLAHLPYLTQGEVKAFADKVFDKAITVTVKTAMLAAVKVIVGAALYTIGWTAVPSLLIIVVVAYMVRQVFEYDFFAWVKQTADDCSKNCRELICNAAETVKLMTAANSLTSTKISL